MRCCRAGSSPDGSQKVVTKYFLDFFHKNQKEASSNTVKCVWASFFFIFLSSETKNKRKKPQNEAKKSITKRGSEKSSFLKVIQFRGELV